MRAGRRALFVSVLALGLGCAPALRAPAPVRELGGDLKGPSGAPVSPARVDELLAEGEARFARRPEAREVSAAERLFLEAVRGDDVRVEGLLGVARVASWRVEHEPDPSVRASLVTLALDAAQWCVRRASGRAECDLALAKALGQQARERPATAHDGLGKMVEALRRVIAHDPGLEAGAPHRVLALVLLRAPGWPVGPGDAEEGLAHARNAVQLFPDHPENLLALAEGLRKTGRGPEARAACERALVLAQRQRDDPDAGDWEAQAERALRDFP